MADEHEAQQEQPHKKADLRDVARDETLQAYLAKMLLSYTADDKSPYDLDSMQTAAKIGFDFGLMIGHLEWNTSPEAAQELYGDEPYKEIANRLIGAIETAQEQAAQAIDELGALRRKWNQKPEQER